MRKVERAEFVRRDEYRNQFYRCLEHDKIFVLGETCCPSCHPVRYAALRVTSAFITIAIIGTLFCWLHEALREVMR